MKQIVTIYSDNQLVRQISSGNQAAFKSLYEVYHPVLYSYAFRLIQDSEKIEDIIQDVFMWIWSRRKIWNPISVRAYLYRAVHNRVMTNFRANRYESSFNEDYDNRDIQTHPLTPQDELINNELGEAIKKTVDSIPERRREILMLRLYQELTYKEIAESLDISINTVDTQLRRAYQLLRFRLKPYRYSQLIQIENIRSAYDA